jgi:hypothetical protein
MEVGERRKHAEMHRFKTRGHINFVDSKFSLISLWIYI